MLKRRPRPVIAATVREYIRLRRTERWSAPRMAEHQRSELRTAIAVARRAPFWAARLPDTDDLAALPVTDKPALRAVPDHDRYTDGEAAARRIIRTSGTTGEPFAVAYSPRGAWYQGVLWLRTRANRGLHAWEDGLSVDVFERDPHTSRLDAVTRRRRVRVDPLDLAPAAAVLRASKARMVSGPGHLLVEVAEAAGGTTLRPRVVSTNGETITPENRAMLRELYGVDPMDTYGTAEAGVVAWQCAASDLYHVNHEAVIVEIIDADGRQLPPGEQGGIALTTLWNELAPFVRYRIGDAAAWADRPCRCGHAQPALTELAGRAPDWIVDEHGQRVSPSRLWLSVHLGVEALPRLRRYRVHQSADRRVLVEIVATERFTTHEVAHLERAYREVLGAVPLDVRLVDHLDIEPGRKFETIRSEAAPASGARTR